MRHVPLPSNGTCDGPGMCPHCDERTALGLDPYSDGPKPADQHVVKVVFQDGVPAEHMRGLLRYLIETFGLRVWDETTWQDLERGIRVDIYPEPAYALDDGYATASGWGEVPDIKGRDISRTSDPGSELD